MGGATMMASPTTAVPPYNYGQDETDGGPPRRSHRALLWILGLLVVLGAVGALAYMMFGGNGKTYAVPLVQGLPRGQGTSRRSPPRTCGPPCVDQPSTSVAKNDVISTNPAQGNNVKANTLVTLFVSSGPQAVSMPNVVGQQVSAAATTLSNLGLNVKQVADTTSTAPKNQVTREVPGGPASVPPGSTVTLYFSGGGVTVPSVIGDTAVNRDDDSAGLRLHRRAQDTGRRRRTPPRATSSSRPRQARLRPRRAPR